MRTTLDLPDDLMHEVKIRQRKKLKDTIVELIRKGIVASQRASERPMPKPVRLRGGFVPTTEDIEAALVEGRV